MCCLAKPFSLDGNTAIVSVKSHLGMEEVYAQYRKRSNRKHLKIS